MPTKKPKRQVRVSLPRPKGTRASSRVTLTLTMHTSELSALRRRAQSRSMSLSGYVRALFESDPDDVAPPAPRPRFSLAELARCVHCDAPPGALHTDGCAFVMLAGRPRHDPRGRVAVGGDPVEPHSGMQGELAYARELALRVDLLDQRHDLEPSPPSAYTLLKTLLDLVVADQGELERTRERVHSLEVELITLAGRHDDLIGVPRFDVDDAGPMPFEPNEPNEPK